jgi:hypothetical protein
VKILPIVLEVPTAERLLVTRTIPAVKLVSMIFVLVILTVVRVPPINMLFEMYALAPDIVVADKRLLDRVLNTPKLELSVPVEILVVARRVPVVRPVLKFKVSPLMLVKTEFVIVLFVAKTEPAVTLPAEMLVARIDPAVASVTLNEEILELVTLLFVIVLLAALKLPTEILAAEIPVEAKSEATVTPEAFTLVALALVITKFVTVPREAKTEPAVTLPAEILVARIDPAVAPVTLNEEILELVTLLFVIVLLAALKLPTEILAAEIPVETKSEATVAPEAFTLVELTLVKTELIIVLFVAKTDPAVTLPAEILVARIDPTVTPVTLNEEMLEFVTTLFETVSFVIMALATVKR